MPRLSWRLFDKGLWVAGGRDSVPDGALRRATGVAAFREGVIRSARGFRALVFGAANQYRRFAGALFQARDDDILRDGVVVNAAFPQSGAGQTFTGPRISFLRMPPQATLDDWLFVAGGNNPFKVRADGTDASKWGIDAPPDGATATPNAQAKNQIDAMDATTGWTRVGPTGVNEVLDNTVFVEGTGSLRWDFEQSATTQYTKDIMTNLNTFGGGVVSADQDYIQLWIRLSGTRTNEANSPAAENFDWLEVAFALGATNFDDNMMTRRIDGIDGVVPIAGLADQEVGVATALEPGAGIQVVLDQAFVDQGETDIVTGEGVFNEAADQRRLLNAISQTQVMRQNDVWQKLMLPKASFDRTGSDAALDWGDVEAIRLTFKRSGNLVIYVDDIALVGGTGMVGDYKYLHTFKNAATGSRSNPNETPVLVKRVQRSSVHLGNLPISTDPQVTHVEGWRSVGNGEAFFKAYEVANGTLTHDDDIADYAGLFTGAHLTAADLPDILQPDEVQLDNAPPPSTITEVLGVPHLARAWWLDSAPDQRGRLFYSPAGRPESNQGFVDVTQTDDPLRAVVRWNDVIYVLSDGGLFRIVGDDEPFVAQEVFGALGTMRPDTVVPSPFGIVYQAPDAVRLFDGNFSSPVAFDAVAPLFRGYAVEGIAPFAGVSAAFYREDYWITDGITVLVVNLATQTWRRYGTTNTFDTLYASDDDTELLGSVGLAAGDTFALDDADADTAITFQVQTGSRLLSADVRNVIQRLFIDLETSGQEVTPTLIFEDAEEVLPVIVAASRMTVEYARLDLARLVAVRLDATILDLVIVYGIELDVYGAVGAGT